MIPFQCITLIFRLSSEIAFSDFYFTTDNIQFCCIQSTEITAGATSWVFLVIYHDQILHSVFEIVTTKDAAKASG